MMEKLCDVADRLVLITGSTGGIGLALAEGFAERGARAMMNGRGPDVLDEECARLNEEGGRVQGVAFDVTDPKAGSEASARIEPETGAIDVLVNNAGIQHRPPLEEFDHERWEALMSTNVSSVFYVTQAVARHMIGRKCGRIINIASVQSELARPGIAPYTATKGAIRNLTRGMCTDWARQGLQINAIAPGYFRTPLNAALVADEEFSGWLARRTPAGRWGNVEELVGAAIFLASDAASFVNGQTIFIDGGITASL
jgi:gluconate 5-dehydrogenase